MNALYVQVMGDTYGSIMVPNNTPHNEIKIIAQLQKHVRRILQNKSIKKIIIIKKIVNFIVKEKKEK